MFAERGQTATAAAIGLELIFMKILGRDQKAAMRLKLVDLPPFSAVAIRALQLVSKSDTRLSELHDLISADPALVTEILRLANSPLYGIRTPIRSSMQATLLLGFDRVKRITLTVAMRSYIGNSILVPIVRACWRHSLACAMVAEELASVILPDADKDAAYTGALLHDIGRLALAAMQPDRYSSLLQSTQESSAAIMQHERELFGIDHCKAGELMIAAWNLPEEFTDIIARHHEVSGSESFNPLALVCLSCRMTDALGFEFIPRTDCPVYEELLRELRDHKRSSMASQPEFARRIEEKMASIESTPGQADRAHSR
jgi:putative nucleotidyltransferase with HDIG domain